MKELQVRLRPHVFLNIFFPDVRRPPDAFELELADVSFQQFIYLFQEFIYLFHRSTTTGEDRRVQRRGELRGRRHPRAPLALGEGRAAGGQARCHRRGELAQTREPGHVRDDRPDGCARKIRRGIRHAGDCLPTAYYFGIFIYFILQFLYIYSPPPVDFIRVGVLPKGRAAGVRAKVRRPRPGDRHVHRQTREGAPRRHQG